MSFPMLQLVLFFMVFIVEIRRVKPRHCYVKRKAEYLEVRRRMTNEPFHPEQWLASVYSRNQIQQMPRRCYVVY